MTSTIGIVAPALAAITWDIPRIIGVVSIVASVFFLLIAVLACRRPSPVRIRWDLARMVLSGVAIVVMAMITRVSTPGPAIGGATLAGVLLGSVQGWSSKIETVENRILARKSAWGVGAWAVGVVVMQSAGVASRTGTLKLGQTISWFGLALLVGSVLGRQRRIADSRAATVAVASVIAGLMVVGGSFRTPLAIAIDGDNLTQDDLCSVMPSDEGFLISRIRGDACDSERGDCGDPASESTTCITSRTLLFGSADEARHAIDLELDRGGTEVAGLGDASSERWTDSQYVIHFHRGPVFAFVLSAQEQSRPAMEIAREIDGRLVVLLGEAATPPGGEGSDADPTGGPTPGVDVPDEPLTNEPDVDLVPGDAGVGDDADQEPFTSADDPEIPPVSAMGAAMAGLIAAAAIGLISVFEAGLLANSVGGRGPWSPKEAVRIINQLWEPAATAAGSPTTPTMTGSPPTTGSGAASGLSPPGPPTTVYVTGAEAEAVIRSGTGSVVPIPGDQQWGQNASMPGEPLVQTDRVGSHGVIRSVGPIVRGPDGQVSVAVEVDPFEQPPPPPPAADEVPPLPPDEEPPPAVDEFPPTPPVDEGPPPAGSELPAGDEPPLPPEVDEGPPTDEPLPPPPADEVPPPPPVDEPPPPIEEDPAPPDEPAPVGSNEEPPPASATDEPPSPDEAPPATDGEMQDVPPEALDDVGLTDQEITDIVNWGREHNRSPEDIRADLAARGGSTSIELPVPLEQVSTPSGPLTLTAEEAAAYREALRRADTLRQSKESLSERMGELQRDAQHWQVWEQNPEWRTVAGVYDVWERQSEYEAARDGLNTELGRLHSRPDPYTYDTSEYSSFDEALTDWQQRDHHGARHDQIEAIERQLADLHNRHTGSLADVGYVGDQARRLTQLREHLKNLKQGNSPPFPEEYPDDDFKEVLRDWETRNSSGRFFEGAERTRREIRGLEASVDHLMERSERGEPVGMRDVLNDAFAEGDQPELARVDPASGTDRGTAFDRPARELERIAREQDRYLGYYRNVDRSLDETERLIAEIESRAGG